MPIRLIQLSRFSIIGTSLLIMAATWLSTGAVSDGVFWGGSIDRALVQRDDFFNRIGFKSCSSALEGNAVSLSEDMKKNITLRLNGLNFPDNPWYNFVRGIIAADSSQDAVSYHFNRSLSIAEKDPGTTWLLFVEFTRFNHHIWAENSLQQLEKNLLSEGAVSVPAVTQQLLYYASVQEKTGNHAMAQNYALWAKRFDPNHVGPSVQIALHSFPARMPEFYNAMGDIFTSVKTNWRMQLALVDHCYFWLRTMIIVLMACVLMIMCIKYLALAVHRGSDFFPVTLPVSLRTVLSIIILLSIMSFGVLLFVWMLLFLLAKHVQKSERYILFAIGLCCALSPFDTLFRSMLQQDRYPDSPTGLYARAMDEGYSQQNHLLTLKRVASGKNDRLVNMAASLYALKCGELDGALKHVNDALALKPADPVALVLAGSLYYLSGDLEKARSYYDRCTRLFPHTVSAHFNTAQCFFLDMQTLKGTGKIRDAAAINASYVNSFIEKNDMYYSKNWPALRRFMFADYSPGYFWTSVFPSEGGWENVRDLWGAGFLGLPPTWSAIIFFILLLALIALTFVSATGRKPRQYFSCTVCGRTICRRCKDGGMCITCADTLKLIRNESTIEKIRISIVSHQKKLRLCIIHLTGMLFPGVQGFLLPKGSRMKGFILIPATSAVYATWALLLLSGSWYPGWAAADAVKGTGGILIVYSGYFVIKGILAIYKTIRTAAT